MMERVQQNILAMFGSAGALPEMIESARQVRTRLAPTEALNESCTV